MSYKLGLQIQAQIDNFKNLKVSLVKSEFQIKRLICYNIKLQPDLWLPNLAGIV